MLSQEFIEEMKQSLLNKQSELNAELAGLTAHNELGSDIDSNIQEVESDEVSQDVINVIKSDLVKIEKALAKIENGTYGSDDEGKEISEARLKVLPWADKAI